LMGRRRCCPDGTDVIPGKRLDRRENGGSDQVKGATPFGTAHCHRKNFE